MTSRLAVAVIVLALVASSYMLYVQGYSRVVGIDDYISDEVWYVSSSINVARKILGLEVVPRLNSSYAVYTVFYNDTLCSSDEVVEALSSSAPGLAVAKSEYEKEDAVALYVPLEHVGAFINASRGLECVVDVMPGIAPDHDGIYAYLNTEHPPLVKYVLALTLWLGGWRPWVWRIPSFVMGLVSLGALAGTLYIVSRRFNLKLIHVVLLSVLLVAYSWRDPVLAAMSSVAMLDVYAAGFDALSVFALVAGRPLVAAILLGLAGSAKYTGLFLYPALLLAVLLDRRLSTRAKLLAAMLPVLIVAASWAPFILARGASWVYREVMGAVEWHTTSRPEGPPTTTPLGMLLGRNGFALYYLPDGEPLLMASCNPGVCSLGLVVGVLSLLAGLLAICNKGSCRAEEYTAVILGAAMPSAWLGYLAVYLAGNKTLYSFYTVQLSVLGVQSIMALPFLVDETRMLSPRSIAACAKKPYAAPVLSALASVLGVSVSIALAGGVFREYFVNPAWSPVYTLLSGGKVERLALAAAAYALYGLAAYKFTDARRRLDTLKWFLAGALTFMSPASVLLAPVVILFLPGRKTFVDGVVAGVLSPTPAVLGLPSIIRGEESRRRVLAGIVIGFTSMLVLVTTYYKSGVAVAGWGAAAPVVAVMAASLLLAYAPLPSAVPLGLMVFLEPGAAPLLAFASTESDEEGLSGLVAAAIAVLGFATGLYIVKLAGLALAITGLVDYYAGRSAG